MRGLAHLGMGANQGKEDETPTSPKSLRVAPVDHASGDETPVPALLVATRKELSEMKSEIMALLQRVVEKVDA